MQYDGAYMEVIFYEWQYGTRGGFFPPSTSLVKYESFRVNGERVLSVGFLLKGNLQTEGGKAFHVR